MKYKKALKVSVLSLLIVLAFAGIVNAFKLGDVIKVGGIVYIVDKYSGNINSFINGIMKNKGVEIKQTTKVVPILSVGEGGYIGACQIAGPKAAVDKCNCAVQYEDDTVFGTNIRARVLVPCATRGVKNVKRVPGVGVSAMIDIKL